eukprot:GDKJ01058438.1.p2 GENE.GDKJ01058438.1~~GDKJ01058438.1.p2  ORF type:complete len:236 (-),score=-10.76 GDKJ01058438.1:489-1196(-)
MLHCALVGKHTIGKAYYPVEHTQGIAHTAFALLRYYVQASLLRYYPFFGSNAVQVVYYVCSSYALEVEYLTTAEDGWQYLVLLCSGKDEDGIWWRFFQRLQKGVEGRSTQHVNLIYDVYLVLTLLRCETYLICEVTYIIYRVVAGSIELEYVEGCIVAEALAGSTGTAGFYISRRVFAIDGLCQYTGAGSFTHTTRTAKQIRMRQMIVANGIFERSGNVLLPHNRIKGLRAVFTG